MPDHSHSFSVTATAWYEKEGLVFSQVLAFYLFKLARDNARPDLTPLPFQRNELTAGHGHGGSAGFESVI